MSATQYCHRSHRFALLACLTSLVAVGCSKPAEPPPRSQADYGSGIVSMEIVQRDMASRRAQAAATAERSDTSSEVTSSRSARLTPPAVAPSRTGLVAVSTRGVVKPAAVTPARHAGKAALAPAAAPVVATAPQESDSAARVPAPSSIVAALEAPTMTPGTTATPPESAPIFPSATAAARQLAPTTSMPGTAATIAPPVAGVVAPAAGIAALAIAPIDDASARIYSKGDAGVIPARLLTTTSTAGLSMDATDVNTMELVINELGRVEQVKLAAPAKRMTDMLLLSGAKLWKFEPATKDGQPVRYRTLVSWQTTR